MRAAARTTAVLSIVAIALGGLAVGPAAAGTGTLELLATNWWGASFSADGSRVAYISDVDGQARVRDFASGAVTLVSSVDGVTGVSGFHQTRNVDISRNGRYVTFATHAQNLDPRDTDFVEDVYLKDLVTGDLVLVSTTGAGGKGNLASFGPAAVSDTGVVVFASEAGNFDPVRPLPADCFPGESFCMEAEVYTKDTVNGALTLVSLGTRGDFQSAVSATIFADISADGTTVALGTADTMTDDDDDLYAPDIFVIDVATGAVVLASNEGPALPNGFWFPSLSGDGTRVAFQGMVTGTDPVIDQVFLRDLTEAAQVLVSRSADGEPANGIAQDGRISADGQTLAFSSRATNLHPDDANLHDDVYLADLTTGSLRLVSETDDGTQGTYSGSQPALAVDGGTAVIFSTFLRNFDPSVTTFDYGWYLKRLAAPAPADGNADGVVDALQPAGTSAAAFVDVATTPVTSGSVVDTGGLSVSISDAPDTADGVLVTVGPAVAGSTRATLSVCGVTLRLTAGTSVVLTCGSVIVETLTGSVQAEVDGGLITVTVPAGTSARISDTAAGAEVSSVAGTGVTVAVHGSTVPIAPGSPASSFASWTVSALKAPVDARPVLNVAKAGRAIPLKWHVSDASGAPVTTLASTTVSVRHLDCGLGTTTDEIEQTFAGGSGLQNLGNGDYQLNWKTGSAWAGSCKAMALDLGGGIVVSADFRFTR